MQTFTSPAPGPGAPGPALMRVDEGSMRGRVRAGISLSKKILEREAGRLSLHSDREKTKIARRPGDVAAWRFSHEAAYTIPSRVRRWRSIDRPEVQLSRVAAHAHIKSFEPERGFERATLLRTTKFAAALAFAAADADTLADVWAEFKTRIGWGMHVTHSHGFLKFFCFVGVSALSR